MWERLHLKKSQSRNKKVSLLLFGIRTKIVICFLIPIVCMVIVGESSYSKASEGLSNKFEESTEQTLRKATEYIDMCGMFIESQGMEYAYDKELSRYFQGSYKEDKLSEYNLLETTKSNLIAAKASNTFVKDIHIITKDNLYMLSTRTTQEKTGIFDEYRDSQLTGNGKIEKWIDKHTVLDEYLNIQESDYIMSYEIMSKNSNAIIVVDIGTDAIESFIKTLDFCEGSIVGFITKSGREIIYANAEKMGGSSENQDEKIFYGQDFYNELDVSGRLSGTAEVNYKGVQYLCIYSRSEENGATVCALVPHSYIISQAEEIKDMTIKMIALASIVTLVVGIFITSGIQNNMKRISEKVGDAANGNLTVHVKVKGHDEFGRLATSVAHMIENTKKLVGRVNNSAEHLGESADKVENVSIVVHDYSKEIASAVNDINKGMERQSKHAQECVVKTNILSDEINEVGKVIKNVGVLVGDSEEMIHHGMDIIQVLGDRAKQTTEITGEVGNRISLLQKESEIIKSFVKMVADIAGQTNLLSLNTAIEAARAGSAGRGFAVVADEINKLSGESAHAAENIRKNVEHIIEHTMYSVKSANQAQEMVALQTQSVEEVVTVFREVQTSMIRFLDGLKQIADGVDKADRGRNDTVLAVKNISDIIESTAISAETVNEVIEKLLESVIKLNQTAYVLGENMQELKTEVSAFKI